MTKTSVEVTIEGKDIVVVDGKPEDAEEYNARRHESIRHYEVEHKKLNRRQRLAIKAILRKAKKQEAKNG